MLKLKALGSRSRHPGIGAGGGALLKYSALLAVVLCCGGCSREVPLPPAAVDPATLAAAAPQVLLAVAGAGGVEWQLVTPGQATPRALHSAAVGATLWALDDEAGEFIYGANDGVWRVSWRQPDRPPQRLADLPALGGGLYAAWFDAASSQLQALEMREATPVERKRIKLQPPDSSPYVAVLWTLTEGRWQIREARDTTWGSDGSLGPAVFDDLRRERGRSARRADDDASCVRLCDQTATAPAGMQANDAEDWRVLPGSDGQIVFGVALGDGWHVVGPVGSTATGKILHAASGNELRLHWYQARLLIAPVRLPAVATIHDLASGAHQVLPASSTAPVWVD